jgi:hypothetical protein
MTESSTNLQPTRRGLLAGIGLGMIGFLASGAKARPGIGTAPGAAPKPLPADLEHGDAASWARQVGQDFTIPALSGVALRLVAVEPALSGGPRPARARQGNFHAVFESVGRALPDGDATYVLSGRSVAALPLFLGRPSGVHGRRKLVASFN